jgi:hypothetical protein
MTIKRRITLEITIAESAAYAGVLVAVMNGLTCSGPPGEVRVVGLSNITVQEVVTLRAPEDRREGA